MPVESSFDIYAITPEDLLVQVNKAGGQRAFARKYNVKRTTLQNQIYRLRRDPLKHRPRPEVREAMPEGGRRRFIISSAQDATKVHQGFLDNLEAYAEYLRGDCPCEIMIGAFTYSKRLFEDHSTHAAIFAEAVRPYLVRDRIRLAQGLDFTGEMNTLPTAEKPLSGFHTYTRHRWGIFPHAKVQLVSVPTMKGTPPKMIMTTGAVTLPNYIPKKAGIKASFHHILAAVLVEVDADETFFCRHLIGEDDGSFYDLDRHIQDGAVSEGNRVAALTPGDVHVAQIDPTVSAITFGLSPTTARFSETRVWETTQDETIISVLNPEHVTLHDVSDFRARNHHEIADPHTRYEHFVNQSENVESELKEVANFLGALDKVYPDTMFSVVDSNHDQAFLRWLKTADYRTDPINAEFFLDSQKLVYKAIRLKDKEFSVFEHVMRSFHDGWCRHVNFLREDKQFPIGDVEHSNHGHRGPNGTRGSVEGMSRIASKVTMGHIHSCAILEGVYAAGTTSLLDLSYNKGASSWSHTHVIQYLNGKRSLITIQNGRWRL